MYELVVNTYNSLKFVHVLSAVVWVGGACTLKTFAIRINGTGDGARMATFAEDAEFVAGLGFATVAFDMNMRPIWAMRVPFRVALSATVVLFPITLSQYP